MNLKYSYHPFMSALYYLFTTQLMLPIGNYGLCP